MSYIEFLYTEFSNQHLMFICRIMASNKPDKRLGLNDALEFVMSGYDSEVGEFSSDEDEMRREEDRENDDEPQNEPQNESDEEEDVDTGSSPDIIDGGEKIQNKEARRRMLARMRHVLTDGDTETYQNANLNSFFLKNRMSKKRPQWIISNSFGLMNLQILWWSKQTCIAPNSQEIV